MNRISPQKARAILTKLLGPHYKLPRIGKELIISENHYHTTRNDTYPTHYYLAHDTKGYYWWRYQLPYPRNHHIPTRSIIEDILS